MKSKAFVICSEFCDEGAVVMIISQVSSALINKFLSPN